MYNHETKDSHAWWAMQEFIAADNSVENAISEFQACAESAVGIISDLEIENEELTEERDEAQKELDKYKSKYMDLHGVSNELIDLLSQTLLVGEKLADFSRNRLVALGALNETQDTDSGSGNSSHGSSENPDDKNAGKTAT